MSVGILAGSQYRPHIIAWMAGLPLRQVAVVIVQVAHKSRIVERGTIWSRLIPTN